MGQPARPSRPVRWRGRGRRQQTSGSLIASACSNGEAAGSRPCPAPSAFAFDAATARSLWWRSAAEAALVAAAMAEGVLGERSGGAWLAKSARRPRDPCREQAGIQTALQRASREDVCSRRAPTAPCSAGRGEAASGGVDRGGRALRCSHGPGHLAPGMLEGGRRRRRKISRRWPQAARGSAVTRCRRGGRARRSGGCRWRRHRQHPAAAPRAAAGRGARSITHPAQGPGGRTRWRARRWRGGRRRRAPAPRRGPAAAALSRSSRRRRRRREAGAATAHGPRRLVNQAGPFRRRRRRRRHRRRRHRR
jgi:hypothetical protein